MRLTTKQQIKWFAFELLLIRINPEFVDGKYAKPIVFDLRKIENCEVPEFELTRDKTPSQYATHFLNEIRGYYAYKHNNSWENSGLSFKEKENKIYIHGYTTDILKQYLREECNSLPTVFDTYEENHRFYILFIDKKTGVELNGEELVAFRLLRKNCYNENIFIKWGDIFRKMGRRRDLLRENNINNFIGTDPKKVAFVYQVIAVKLAKKLKKILNDPNYTEKDIIIHKYGGYYRLGI